ncbi:MAG: hypothetical protein KGK33_17645 [Hyphomicrobiales bacterium]|nr:hypothetical protein [Hyphomicrobiales bacterium]
MSARASGQSAAFGNAAGGSHGVAEFCLSVKAVFHQVAENFHFWQCSEDDHGKEEKSKTADHETEVREAEGRTGPQEEKIGKVGGEEEGREKEVCTEAKSCVAKAGAGPCTIT